MKKSYLYSIFLTTLLGVLFYQPNLHSAGPIMVVPGEEVAPSWDRVIPLDLESGSCAGYSNAEATNVIENNLDILEDIDGNTLSFQVNRRAIDEDVNSSNFNSILSLNPDTFLSEPDNLTPLVFDDDGEIIRSLFGELADLAVLGVAGPDFIDGTSIVEGKAIFNCKCLENANNLDDCVIVNNEDNATITFQFTENDFIWTIMHELGHLIGLDHTAVNEELFSDCLANGVDCERIPLMFPISSSQDIEPGLHRDDEVSILSLYGDATWETDFCTLTGIIADSEGVPSQCIQLELTSFDNRETISSVSGTFVPFEDKDLDGLAGLGECLDDCGRFIFKGVDPRVSYTLKIKPIPADFVNGSSVGPCRSGQLRGIDEEDLLLIPNCARGVETDLNTLQGGFVFDETNVANPSDNLPNPNPSGNSNADSDCGVDQDFSSCDEVLGCSLQMTQDSSFPKFILLFFLLFQFGYFLNIRFHLKK